MTIVYILVSEQDKSKHYVGITQNLPRRIKDHNDKLGGYTKHYAPWKIETYITFENQKLAEQFERYLKAGSATPF